MSNALPPGWRRERNVSSGRNYYVDPYGDEQYTHPVAAIAAAAPNALPPGWVHVRGGRSLGFQNRYLSPMPEFRLHYRRPNAPAREGPSMAQIISALQEAAPVAPAEEGLAAQNVASGNLPNGGNLFVPSGQNSALMSEINPGDQLVNWGEKNYGQFYTAGNYNGLPSPKLSPRTRERINAKGPKRYTARKLTLPNPPARPRKHRSRKNRSRKH